MAGAPLDELPRRPLSVFPGWRAALGPGIVWMALAQGSGELIWWPYMVAKYGLTFLCLLVPACLLQYPLNVEIGRYTLVTGESIFHGFIRLGRGFGILLWVLMTLSFLWFGAFASAGGTALAALTGFPAGWTPRGQTLFWGYLSIAVFLVAILLSRVVYALVEGFMKVVAVVTVAGLVWACLQPDVLAATPAFLRGLLGPAGSDAPAVGSRGRHQASHRHHLRRPRRILDPAVFVLAAREGQRHGRARRPHHGPAERHDRAGARPTAGCPPTTRRPERAGSQWRRYLTGDALVGIGGNLATTLMTCLLAWALLFPHGLLPQDYDLAVVQARFFEASWGPLGRVIFLVVAAAFLTDTWLATADGVSRMQADIVQTLFPSSRRLEQRQWYFIFLGLLTVVTCFTMLLEAPGPLILLSAVIGFAGTVIFPVALYLLNHRRLAPVLPVWARPRPVERLLLGLCFVAYLGLAVAYLWQTFAA